MLTRVYSLLWHLFIPVLKLHLDTEVTTVKKIQLAKLGFSVAATASFFFSVYLWFSGNKDEGVFVGIWVPSILSFGTLVLSGKSNG